MTAPNSVSSDYNCGGRFLAIALQGGHHCTCGKWHRPQPHHTIEEAGSAEVAVELLQSIHGMSKDESIAQVAAYLEDTP